MINERIRTEAVIRRFKFEAMKAVGFLWFIERIGLKLKEPWNKLYQRSKKQ